MDARRVHAGSEFRRAMRLAPLGHRPDHLRCLALAARRVAVVGENNWLRSWTNDLYLWFDEVVDRNPALFTTPAYFDLLKTTATTPSGNPKDKFHFTYDTAAWVAL